MLFRYFAGVEKLVEIACEIDFKGDYIYLRDLKYSGYLYSECGFWVWVTYWKNPMEALGTSLPTLPGVKRSLLISTNLHTKPKLVHGSRINPKGHRVGVQNPKPCLHLPIDLLTAPEKVITILSALLV